MKSGLHKQFKTNTTAETGGLPVRFEPNADGTVPTFMVARMGGANQPAFSKAHAEVWALHKEDAALNQVSAELETELGQKAFIRGCLRGWSNVQEEDGTPIPFSEPAALNLFKELPDIYHTLHARSLSLSAYLAINTEVAAKN